MKNDKEFEMLLNEIPQTHSTSFNLHQQQQHNSYVHGHGTHGTSSNVDRSYGMYGMFDDDQFKYKPVSSPVSGFNLQSEGSTSSLLSGWFSSDEDGSQTPTMLEDIKPQTPFRNAHYDSPLGRSSVENLVNDLGRMYIKEGIEEASMNRRLGSDLYGFDRNYNGNVEKNGAFGNGVSDLRRIPLSPTSFNEDRSSALLGLQQNLQKGNFSTPGRYTPLFFGQDQYADNVNTSQKQFMDQTLSNLQLQADASLGGNYYGRGVPVPYTGSSVARPSMEETISNLRLQADAVLRGNLYDRKIPVPYNASSITRPSMSGAMLYQQQNPMYSIGQAGVSNLLSSSHMTERNVPLGMESLMQCNLPMPNGRLGATTELMPQTPTPVRGSQDFEVFDCEDSLIIQGKGLNYVIKKRRGCAKEARNEIGRTHLKQRSSELAYPICSTRTSFVNSDSGSDMMYSPLSPPLTYDSLLNVQDYIYYLAKDQQGCRLLQQKFDEGSPQDKQMIFQELIDHVVELMTNQFGNYLVQKLLEKCNAEQRMKILLMVTKTPGELVRISLNMHGTRAVQKLISTLKTQQEKLIVISALEPGFLDLIKDLNGNHVLQYCLQNLENEENKFIYKSAAKFCFEIATHRHGCCVLQRCITYATGKDREILLSKVSSNGLRLAQDAFGNYVIQFVLELKIPSANATLMSQFERNYVLLSMQKFSSNVVEKCLKVFGEDGRSVIIHEFLSSSQLEKLLQDPYANYVIQSALRITKGPLNAALVEAIRQHEEVLKTNPYCKKIFSWTCSKK
ncbi:hypothetical protein IFM89_005273 [Coptis chinensis]|uniref:PUM-HD domain-containing protein n=1 Tax=Coptis chinensis TaxID=261450 RepID=A0A835IUA9_9MAGN|nr:hypothetical protein IFM89_005273 [Coptis chinensis]